MFIEQTDRICFVWPVEYLFDRISAGSMYVARAKTLPNSADGANIDSVDVLGISEDENDFVVTHLRDSLHRLFSLFSSVALPAQDAVFFERRRIRPEDASEQLSCGFYIVRHCDETGSSRYNPSTPELAESACAEYLVNSVLSEWFSLAGLIDDATLFKSTETDAAKILAPCIFELSKPLYARSYTKTFIP